MNATKPQLGYSPNKRAWFGNIESKQYMNTIVVIDPGQILMSLSKTSEGPTFLSSALTKVVRDEEDMELFHAALPTAAWYITPGSLHANGEVYQYRNSALYIPRITRSRWWRTPGGVKPVLQYVFSNEERDVPPWLVEGHVDTKADLILPRGIEDDLRSLAGQHGYVYFLRTPAIGLGKLPYIVGEEYAPMLVLPVEPVGRASRKQKQKHVSKPTSHKQRH